MKFNLKISFKIFFFYYFFEKKYLFQLQKFINLFQIYINLLIFNIVSLTKTEKKGREEKELLVEQVMIKNLKLQYFI